MSETHKYVFHNMPRSFLTRATTGIISGFHILRAARVKAQMKQSRISAAPLPTAPFRKLITPGISSSGLYTSAPGAPPDDAEAFAPPMERGEVGRPHSPDLLFL
jgi:hypothetical protein